jgi:hypothetical protein
MKVIRVYTGKDNRSHFEEMPLPFARDRGGESTPPLAAPGVLFHRRRPGHVLDWHCAPRRQYVVTLAGQGEIEVGDGTVQRFGPGDILLAEDLTGQGHISRVVGDEPRVSVWIPLER